MAQDLGGSLFAEKWFFIASLLYDICDICHI